MIHQSDKRTQQCAPASQQGLNPVKFWCLPVFLCVSPHRMSSLPHKKQKQVIGILLPMLESKVLTFIVGIHNQRKTAPKVVRLAKHRISILYSECQQLFRLRLAKCIGFYYQFTVLFFIVLLVQYIPIHIKNLYIRYVCIRIYI